MIVVGAGLAGLSAAVRASDLGADVLLVSPSPSEQAQSVMAMGGINAALNTKGENDSTDDHFRDTINGGCEINSPKSVEKLVQDAPKIIDWLSEIGVSFNRDEAGNVDLRYFGGQKKMRTAYAGARTGKQLVTALTSQCLKRQAEGSVKRLIGWRFLSLIIEDGEASGVVLINEDTSEIRSFLSDAVIIASGGLNSLFGRTSGSSQNDAFATAKLFMQGVELSNLEMIQYHPTTVRTPSKRMLITEAARGEGGNLYVIKDGKPWYFMKEWYPEFGELMPRDVVSRSIYNVCDEMGLKEVYLDVSHLPQDTVIHKLDEVYEISMNYLGIDPTESPIPVYPGIHYFMGGIRTNENHETNIKRLFAAGECSSQYHGANRLGGNSLLGAIHGGLVAAENACRLDESTKTADDSLLDSEIDEFNKWNESKGNHFTFKTDEELSEIMNDTMGIYRDEDSLSEAINKINELSVENTYENYYDYNKIKHLIMLSKAMILSAIARKESRGAHQRKDYPETDDKYKKLTCVNYDGEINISFKDLD